MSTTPSLTDLELTTSVAEVVSRPRRTSPDSFVLHAPLEVAARWALLPACAPERRPAARDRLAEIATRYEAFSPAVEAPDEVAFSAPGAAADALAAAVAAGDPDLADAVATWIGANVPNAHVPALTAAAVIPSLAAAAHGSILLYQLPRVAPRQELTAALLRPLARELARRPEWQVTWPHGETAVRDHAASGPTLAEAIATVPFLGLPGSDFIYPLMSQVQDSGMAADVLGSVVPTAPAEAARVLGRTAAMAMLQEPLTHAPYGWTHCLTMPQAVLGIADRSPDPAFAVAVAATYVVGFRAGMGSVALDPNWSPEPATGVTEETWTDPDAAAAAAWYTPPSGRAALVTRLATAALGHHDAHFVKYTLACLDASAADPGGTRCYLAAAARLAAVWATTG